MYDRRTRVSGAADPVPPAGQSRLVGLLDQARERADPRLRGPQPGGGPGGQDVAQGSVQAGEVVAGRRRRGRQREQAAQPGQVGQAGAGAEYRVGHGQQGGQLRQVGGAGLAASARRTGSRRQSARSAPGRAARWSRALVSCSRAAARSVSPARVTGPPGWPPRARLAWSASSTRPASARTRCRAVPRRSAVAGGQDVTQGSVQAGDVGSRRRQVEQAAQPGQVGQAGGVAEYRVGHGQQGEQLRHAGGAGLVGQPRELVGVSLRPDAVGPPGRGQQAGQGSGRGPLRRPSSSRSACVMAVICSSSLSVCVVPASRAVARPRNAVSSVRWPGQVVRQPDAEQRRADLIGRERPMLTCDRACGARGCTDRPAGPRAARWARTAAPRTGSARGAADGQGRSAGPGGRLSGRHASAWVSSAGVAEFSSPRRGPQRVVGRQAAQQLADQRLAICGGQVLARRRRPGTPAPAARARHWSAARSGRPGSPGYLAPWPPWPARPSAPARGPAGAASAAGQGQRAAHEVA